MACTQQKREVTLQLVASACSSERFLRSTLVRSISALSLASVCAYLSVNASNASCKIALSRGEHPQANVRMPKLHVRSCYIHAACHEQEEYYKPTRGTHHARCFALWECSMFASSMNNLGNQAYINRRITWETKRT